MKKEYCVYVHTNKTNGKKYIGITSRKPESRWNRGGGYKQNPYFYNSIVKYGWDGFDHEVIASGLTKEQACAWERALIAQFDTTKKKNGYNVGLGGEGAQSISMKTRKKMSAKAKQRFEDPEEVRKNRERGLRQFSTQEAIEADRKTQIKFHEDNPEARYRRARAVNQYDLGGHFLRQWKSIRDASLGTGCNESCIRGCCLGGIRSSLGYMWRFSLDVNATEDIGPVRERISQCKPVNQYSLDGVLVKRWSGISEAETALHIKNLSEVCNGRRDQAAGYMWKFADEENRKQIDPYRNKNCRRIIQFDKNGEYIRDFNSIKDAVSITGISRFRIKRACKGLNKTVEGFIWRYADELQDKAI